MKMMFDTCGRRYAKECHNCTGAVIRVDQRDFYLLVLVRSLERHPLVHRQLANARRTNTELHLNETTRDFIAVKLTAIKMLGESAVMVGVEMREEVSRRQSFVGILESIDDHISREI